MAHEFKLDPWQIQRAWTHRQFEAARRWLKEQWNRPSRADHYAMLVCEMINRLPYLTWGSKPPELDLDKFRVKFETGRNEAKEEEHKLTPAEWGAQQSAAWGGIVRSASKVRNRNKVSRGEK